ncbi:DUF2254 domain-containing protein [Alteribacillus bidgolensis]|uniref:Uncharacterized membrane protein n=1 Tax=Alteribacillus bidgolensis TaxID=930129 RepID=A0A1G8EFI9_9BACI|nr:DUF2254 domain-containing protein [Alteribacillus bidgolensis]SDH68668.1 Uncharacterized membrane protein [Alteribacillus bidgolensis]
MRLKNFLPRPIRKLSSMSYRQIWYELRSNLWFSSLIYAVFAVVLIFFSYWLDFTAQIKQYMPDMFLTTYELTYILVSTLIAGILTLNAFTFNSILVVLTSFSGQFSPRMLSSFISDRRTQHVIGIFNACFLYVLIAFFLINEEENGMYVAIPIFTVISAFLALSNFVFFINHAVKWMQVPNLTNNMKYESQQTILRTLLKDLEPYRTKEPNHTEKELNEREGHVIAANAAGFIQIFDYKHLIKEAKRDKIILRLERRIGDFVTEGMPIITYWKIDDTAVNEFKYRRLIYLGPKKTEVQDLEFGVNKLTEIAIKAIGNSDPNTANNVIYQLADLLVSISKVTRFTPYLTDIDNKLRLIIKEESFDYYLYSAFSQISVYAKNDPFLTTNILEAITILSHSVPPENHLCCWEFAKTVARGYKEGFTYAYNEQRFYNSLRGIAQKTGHLNRYKEFEQEIKSNMVIEK